MINEALNIKQIEYNDKGSITWISSNMEFEFNRGNVSRELWLAIDEFLNTKKG